MVSFTQDSIPIKPVFHPPQDPKLTPSTQERDLCGSCSHSEWGNEYLKRGIWIPDLTECPKLGQFVQEEERDIEGPAIPLRKTHKRKKEQVAVDQTV